MVVESCFGKFDALIDVHAEGAGREDGECFSQVGPVEWVDAEETLVVLDSLFVRMEISGAHMMGRDSIESP